MDLAHSIECATQVRRAYIRSNRKILSQLGSTLRDYSWVIRIGRQSHRQFFLPKGSIYSNDFRPLLLRAGMDPNSDGHHPKDCPEESEFTTWSKNVKRVELNVKSHAIKGTWQVKKGATGAVLLMNKPRIKTSLQMPLGSSRTSSSFSQCTSLPRSFIVLPSPCTSQIRAEKISASLF